MAQVQMERHVWYVLDPEDTYQPLFETKMDAERFARYTYPDEDPDKRYSRIRCRRVYTFDDGGF